MIVSIITNTISWVPTVSQITNDFASNFIEDIPKDINWLAIVSGLVFLAFTIITIWELAKKLDSYEEQITFNAIGNNMNINYPLLNETPLVNGEVSFSVIVKLEIWTTVNINTSILVLNMIANKNFIDWKSWKFWRPFGQKPLFAIPIDGSDNQSNDRRTILATDKQPFEESVVFKWRGRLDDIKWGDGSFFPELALKLAIPKRTLRSYLDDPRKIKFKKIVPL